MINGSLVNRTSFSDNFPELTWGERGAVFLYLLGILVTSSVGNTFVLVLSKDLKSVTKDSKGTILLINIALVDLLFNVFLTLPMLVSVLTREWVLGTGYCFLDAFFETYLGILEIMLILLITVHRTLVIKFPFKQQRMLTTRKVYVILVILYIFCLIPSIIRIVATTQIIGYLPEELHCDNLEVASSGPWTRILQISLVIYALIPVVVTVVLYIWMMLFAMTKSEPNSFRSASYNHRIKNGGGTQMKAPNKALQTVSLIVGIYLISISMTIIIIIVRIRSPNLPHRLHLASICLWLLNTAVNPIIYVYNNPMFRAHLRRLILRKRKEYGASSSVMSMRRRTTQQSIMKMASSTFSRSSSLSSSANGGGVVLPRESVVATVPKMGVVEEESSGCHGDALRRRMSDKLDLGNGMLVLSEIEEGDGSLVIHNSSSYHPHLGDPSCVLTDHSCISSEESRVMSDESRVRADVAMETQRSDGMPDSSYNPQDYLEQSVDLDCQEDESSL